MIGLATLAFLRTRPGDTVAPTRGASPVVVVSGLAVGTSEPFFLEPGRYRALWSAWGQGAADPPCTHSVELAAPDKNVSVVLAKSVQVPSTGQTVEVDVATADPGEYVLRIDSECAWQVELRPSE